MNWGCRDPSGDRREGCRLRWATRADREGAGNLIDAPENIEDCSRLVVGNLAGGGKGIHVVFDAGEGESGQEVGLPTGPSRHCITPEPDGGDEVGKLRALEGAQADDDGSKAIQTQPQMSANVRGICLEAVRSGEYRPLPEIRRRHERRGGDDAQPAPPGGIGHDRRRDLLGRRPRQDVVRR